MLLMDLDNASNGHVSIRAHVACFHDAPKPKAQNPLLGRMAATTMHIMQLFIS